MARKPITEQSAPEAVQDSALRFVLKKNHGYIANGRLNKFYAAGTEFDAEADANLIAELVKTGATFE